MYSYEIREILGDKLSGVNHNLSKIRKIYWEEYTISRLKSLVKYLAARYEGRWKIDGYFDEIIFFITSSISSKYFNYKNVILDALEAYIGFRENCTWSIDIGYFLKLAPYAIDDDNSSELWEFLYEKYYESVKKINDYYEQYVYCFKINTNTSVALEGVGLHEAIIESWKENKEDIISFSKKYTVSKSQVWVDSMETYFNNVISVEKKAEEDKRIADIVSVVKKQYYEEGRKSPYRPGYITRVYTPIKED